MNLYGFCGADPSACGFRPPPPPPPPQQNQPGFDLLKQRVENALYHIMARLGCRLVCPSLIGVGALIGGSVLGGTSLVLGGFTVTISAAEGAALGAEVGRAIQQEVCNTCGT